VADKRCVNGHFIDETWDICPYCPSEPSTGDIPVVRPGRSEDLRSGEHVPPRSGEVRRPTRPGTPARATPEPVERTVAAVKFDGQVQAKRYVVGWLIGLNGTARGESYAIRMGRNVLGRDRHSDIPINDDQASSHHADLVFRPDERRFILMDHNSTNGTYVNEVEIEPRRDLERDDIVRIGTHNYLFFPLCGEGIYWDDEGVLK
jgi:FHA domain